MTSEEDSQSILKEIDDYLQAENQRPLTGAQRVLLEWFLKDPSVSYSRVAEASEYEPGSLRDAASKLFKKIAPIISPNRQEKKLGKFDKRSFSEAVKAWYQHRTSRSGIPVPERDAELNRLVAEVNHLGRRLICVSGPIGIGKTRFVQVLGRQLKESSQEGFEHQIFCFASEVPTVKKLYRHVAKELFQGRVEPQTDPILALTDLLRHRRLLLIIDRGDLLCDPGSVEGRFKPEAQSYEQWLSNLRDVFDLQSCLIWVGRIEPGLLQVRRDHLTTHRLRPLQAASAQTLLRERFQDYRFNPSRQDIETLAAFCGYNPGVLDLAVRKICEDGGNNIARFLAAPLQITHAEDGDWQTFLNSITPQEQALLGWLLLYPDEKKHPHENITSPSEQFSAQFSEQFSAQSYEDRQWVQDGLRAAQTLRRRGLLETDREGYYFLQSPWLCHVAARHLVDRLGNLFKSIASQPETEPLLAENTQLLAQHPLIVPQAPAWKRHWHRRHVLKALIEELPECLWSREAKQQLIDRLLQYIRRAGLQDARWRDGYAVGNLLNLAVATGIPLKNLDFSGLVIRHADLRGAQVQQANFSHCQLRDTVLPVLLHGAIATALSPDGSTIAIGDSRGWVLCWRRDRRDWQLDRFTQIADGSRTETITKLAFADERRLAIATPQGIYNWFLYDGEQPQPIALISSPVTSLICSPDYVAAGLQNGEICLWSSIRDQAVLLPQHHTNAVEALVFNPENDRLASLGFEDRILVWNLFELEAEPDTIRLMFRPEAIAWQGEQLLTVGLFEGRYQIGSPTGQKVNLPYAHAEVAGMGFSSNGEFLAVIHREAIEVWNTQNSPNSPNPQQLALAHRILISDPLLIRTLSEDGDWLLTLSQDQTQVQLWGFESGQLHWEQRSTEIPDRIQASEIPPTLQDCTGLTAVEALYFRALGTDLENAS